MKKREWVKVGNVFLEQGGDYQVKVSYPEAQIPPIKCKRKHCVRIPYVIYKAIIRNGVKNENNKIIIEDDFTLTDNEAIAILKTVYGLGPEICAYVETENGMEKLSFWDQLRRLVPREKWEEKLSEFFNVKGEEGHEEEKGIGPREN